MLDKEVVIIGYSGHGFVVADAAIESSMKLKFYAEQNEMKINPFNLEFIGNEHENNFLGWKKDVDFILGIGDNFIRKKVAFKVLEKGKTILNVTHPTASISKNVIIGIGNFISKNVCINPLTTIGNLCILNTGCLIEHECKIGDAVHIAPGAVLAGNVTVGNNTFIGANSVIKQGINIGDNVIIGAGSVVLFDIEDNTTYVGNPAKKKLNEG